MRGTVSNMSEELMLKKSASGYLLLFKQNVFVMEMVICMHTKFHLYACYRDCCVLILVIAFPRQKVMARLLKRCLDETEVFEEPNLWPMTCPRDRMVLIVSFERPPKAGI